MYCFLTEGSDDETDLQSFYGRIRSVAKFDLPPGRPAGQKVEVTFSYDDNQTMQCSFKDCKTGKNYTIDTKPALWGVPKNTIDFDDWVSSVEASQFTISDEINSDEGDSI